MKLNATIWTIGLQIIVLCPIIGDCGAEEEPKESTGVCFFAKVISPHLLPESGIRVWPKPVQGQLLLSWDGKQLPLGQLQPVSETEANEIIESMEVGKQVTAPASLEHVPELILSCPASGQYSFDLQRRTCWYRGRKMIVFPKTGRLLQKILETLEKDSLRKEKGPGESK